MPKSEKSKKTKRRTTRIQISNSSRKIHRLSQKLVKELSKNNSSDAVKSLKKLTNTLNNRQYNKTLKTKKTLRKSRRAGSSVSNKKSKIEKLMVNLQKEIKKVLNGKTKAQNMKKLKKLEKDLLAISQSKKRAGVGFGKSSSLETGSLETEGEENTSKWANRRDKFLKKTGKLNNKIREWVGEERQTMGKVVGNIAEFAVIATTIGLGIEAVDIAGDVMASPINYAFDLHENAFGIA